MFSNSARALMFLLVLCQPAFGQTAMTGGGLAVPASGASYSAEATALFARMSTPPDTTRKGVINNLIVSLISGGVWAKLDALWVLAAADSQAALLNWKSTSFNAALVSTPAFAADRGFTNTGATAYVNSTYAASTAGGLLTLDNAHFSVWSRSATIGPQTTFEAGAGNLVIAPYTSAGNFSFKVNATSTTAETNTDTSGAGYFLVNRVSSTNQQKFRNGSQMGVDAVVGSISLSSLALRLGGLSTATSREWAAGSVGAGLSAGEITAFYNALQTYMTAVGA